MTRYATERSNTAPDAPAPPLDSSPSRQIGRGHGAEKGLRGLPGSPGHDSRCGPWLYTSLAVCRLSLRSLRSVRYSSTVSCPRRPETTTWSLISLPTESQFPVIPTTSSSRASSPACSAKCVRAYVRKKMTHSLYPPHVNSVTFFRVRGHSVLPGSGHCRHGGHSSPRGSMAEALPWPAVCK